MRRHSFMQVDAFTRTPLEGNPCAIVFDADDLDEETMLAIAREMNLSETSFVLGSKIADIRARYFTPAEEIPLAGHPTIATVFALVESGRLKLAGRHTTISLELQVGAIQVEIHANGEKVDKVVMFQKKPQFLATYDAERVAPCFGLHADDVLPEVPIQTVSTGTPQLMVPLRSTEALDRAYVVADKYQALKGEGDFFSPHLFIIPSLPEGDRTLARHFGVPPDLREDPFTGSATGGMAAYLWHYGLCSRPSLIAEQGHWMHRPGLAEVEIVGPRHDIATVKVGGPAVTVMAGDLYV